MNIIYFVLLSHRSAIKKGEMQEGEDFVRAMICTIQEMSLQSELRTQLLSSLNKRNKNATK